MKNVFAAVIILLTMKSLSAQHVINGTIVSRVGPKLVIKVDSIGALPGPKDSCDISKDISGTNNPFGINITNGWVGIGKIMYVSNTGNKYQFRIAKETTTVVINGEKKEQFVMGKKVKVEWK